MSFNGKLRDKLIKEEGYRSQPYQDKGGWSVGIGRNFTYNPFTSDELKYLGLSGKNTRQELQRRGGISRSEALYLMDNDISIINKSLSKHLDWYNDSPEDVKLVLADMAYNMGIGSSSTGKGLLGFKNTLNHIKNGEYGKASLGIMDSKYANDVPQRAYRNSESLAMLDPNSNIGIELRNKQDSIIRNKELSRLNKETKRAFSNDNIQGSIDDNQRFVNEILSMSAGNRRALNMEIDDNNVDFVNQILELSK